jgi:hypothetical protein
MRATKNLGRSVTVRTISGHAVAAPANVDQTPITGTAPENRVGTALSGRQPNTDRRRFLVTGDSRR